MLQVIIAMVIGFCLVRWMRVEMQCTYYKAYYEERCRLDALWRSDLSFEQKIKETVK
jgi:hypothetical protein